ncbi:CmeU family protein [Campylobacter volucris]|uniref:CmeU family protein n=1 Tax=Campylobacter volucris TaxID=1031542 RepID=UPI001E31BD3E
MIFFKLRKEFYAFFDEHILKMEKVDIFDFSKAKTMDAKEVYNHFYKFDYAIRKCLPDIYRAFDISYDKDIKKDF